MHYTKLDNYNDKQEFKDDAEANDSATQQSSQVPVKNLENTEQNDSQDALSIEVTNPNPKPKHKKNFIKKQGLKDESKVGLLGSNQHLLIEEEELGSSEVHREPNRLLKKFCQRLAIGILFIAAFLATLLAVTLAIYYSKQHGKGGDNPFEPRHEYIFRYRLPKSLQPISYDLLIDTNLKASKFVGQVTIQMKVLQSTYHIVLHADPSLHILSSINLFQINHVKKHILNKTSSEITRHHISHYKMKRNLSLQQIEIESVNQLINGSLIELKLSFRGSLKRNDFMGFYMSSSPDDIKQKRFMASTQFEPVGARLAFPCLDEPQFKAKFYLTLLGSINDTLIANTDTLKIVTQKTTQQSTMSEQYAHIFDKVDLILNEFKTIDLSHHESHNHHNHHHNNNSKNVDYWNRERKLVVFESTPIMSTYLLAFVVADNESLAYEELDRSLSPLNGSVRVRVYAKPWAIKAGQAKFALNIASAILEYFSKAFRIPFELKKCDLVAVPEFAAGAMENQGLVTFRETALLYDPRFQSTFQKQQVAQVITHELAHQWFGDLVTMEQQNNIFLNEGMATLMEYVGISSILNEWNIYKEQFFSSIARVQIQDSYKSSRALVPNAAQLNSNMKVNQMFDSITYTKGSAIINMICSFLHREYGNQYNSSVVSLLQPQVFDTFLKNVPRYLKQFQFANSNWSVFIDDLSLGWEKQFGKNNSLNKNKILHQFFESFVLQNGLPLLNIENISVKVNDRNQTYIKIDGTQREQLTGSLDSSNLTKQKLQYLIVDFHWACTNTMSFNSMQNKVQIFERRVLGKNEKFSIEIFTEHLNSSNYEICMTSLRRKQTPLIKMNTNQNGYYRVNYPQKTWLEFENLLKKSSVFELENSSFVLSPNDRSGLISDLFELSLSPSVPNILPEHALNFISFINKERDFGVQSVALFYINRMKFLITYKEKDSNCYNNFTNYVTNELMEGLVNKFFNSSVLSVEGHYTPTKLSHSKKLLRSQIFSNGVRFNDEKLISIAHNLQDHFIKSNKSISSIDSDLRYTVMITASKKGWSSKNENLDELFWRRLEQGFKNKAQSVQAESLLALTHSTNLGTIRNLLWFILPKSSIFKDDTVLEKGFSNKFSIYKSMVVNVVSQIAQNQQIDGVEFAQNALIGNGNWKHLSERYGYSISGQILLCLIDAFTEQSHIDRLESQYENQKKSQSISASATYIDQSYEKTIDSIIYQRVSQIKNAFYIANMYKSGVCKWLEQKRHMHL